MTDWSLLHGYKTVQYLKINQYHSPYYQANEKKMTLSIEAAKVFDKMQL